MFSQIYAIPVTELGGSGTHASVAVLVAYCIVDSGHPCAFFLLFLIAICQVRQQLCTASKIV